MHKEGGRAWNKVWGAVLALVIGPLGLLLYEPPRSYLLACAALCFGWYEAFGLHPGVRHTATMSDIYRAFRAMPAGRGGLSSRLVGLLGLALVIAAMLVRPWSGA